MLCWACGSSPSPDFLEAQPRRTFQNTLETSTVKLLGQILVCLASHLIWGQGAWALGKFGLSTVLVGIHTPGSTTH